MNKIDINFILYLILLKNEEISYSFIKKISKMFITSSLEKSKYRRWSDLDTKHFVYFDVYSDY